MHKFLPGDTVYTQYTQSPYEFVQEYPEGTYILRQDNGYGNGYQYETVSKIYTEQERQVLTRTREIERYNRDIKYHTEQVKQAKQRLAKLTRG